MSKNTGGPAFPIPEIPPRVEVNALGGTTHFPHVPAREGITMRDYFAAKAMQGLLASRRDNTPLTTHDCECIARESYGIADAMLAIETKGDK